MLYTNLLSQLLESSQYGLYGMLTNNISALTKHLRLIMDNYNHQ